MKTTKHAIPALILAAMVMGSVACSPATDSATPGTATSGAAATDTPATAEASSAASSAASSMAAAPTAEPSAGTSMSESAEAAPAEDAMITITDFEYQMPDSIAPGAEVTVTNEDTAPHTVTADGKGDFNVEVGPGESVTFTAPEKAGEYPVICTYHPQMSATMIMG